MLLPFIIFINIPVLNLYAVGLVAGQMSEKRIGHGHGTVFASGAPHSDHQLVLSLTDVIGEKEINQVIQFIPPADTSLNRPENFSALL